MSGIKIQNILPAKIVVNKFMINAKMVDGPFKIRKAQEAHVERAHISRFAILLSAIAVVTGCSTREGAYSNMRIDTLSHEQVISSAATIPLMPDSDIVYAARLRVLECDAYLDLIAVSSEKSAADSLTGLINRLYIYGYPIAIMSDCNVAEAKVVGPEANQYSPFKVTYISHAVLKPANSLTLDDRQVSWATLRLNILSLPESCNSVFVRFSPQATEYDALQTVAAHDGGFVKPISILQRSVPVVRILN